MIRIVGGKYRHRVLDQPSLEITRCSKDSVKEGLFSSLGNDVENKVFLDLFAGSGGVGIESYSRKAKKVYLNDKNKEPINVIKNNLKKLDINDIVVTNFDYFKALEYYKQNNIIFDIVFLDPPYKMEFDFNVISLLKSYNILSDNHIIIIERDSKINDTNLLNYKVKELKYGKTYIYILRSEYENSNLSR